MHHHQMIRKLTGSFSHTMETLVIISAKNIPKYCSFRATTILIRQNNNQELLKPHNILLSYFQSWKDTRPIKTLNNQNVPTTKKP